MTYASRTTNVAALLVVLALSGSALAQGAIVLRATCQGVGIAPQEPVGDREGHTYSVSQYSCQNQGGPFDGAIMTGSTIWESDKGAAVALSGSGVVRKPGMSAIFVVTEAKNTLTMADGKVTGFSGTARGVYKVAAGTASGLAGKSFSSTFRSTGNGQFVIETTVD